MPSRLQPAALALVAALLGACGGGERATPSELPPKEFEASVPEGFFGINGQGLLPMAAGQGERLGRHLDRIRAGGIDFVRVHADWTALQPTPPGPDGSDYDFDRHDAWMRALARRGLSWQLLVTGTPTPEWARAPEAAEACGFRAAPERISDVVALSRALARRYGRDGSFWRRNPELPYRPVTDYEIWNEPNFGSFWCPTPDPELYAELLADAATAVHAVDSDATVLFGGLAGWKNTAPATDRATAHLSVPDFLGGVLAARPDIARLIDGVAIHAYGTDPGAVLADVAWYREALREAGLGRLPIALNETGWYTHGVDRGNPATPEAQRAGYYIALAHLIAQTDCRLSSFAPHTWITNEHNLATVEDWFGIADPGSGEPRPSGEAYIDQVLLHEGRGEEPPPHETRGLCDAG